MKNSWFIIVNPTSGNGKSLNKLNTLKTLLIKYNISFKIIISEYIKHEKKLVQTAIKEGYKKIISVGGDGTLHHIINGIMFQNEVKSSEIKVAVIPFGTGNDWVKTYNITNNLEKNIKLIKKENSVYQDVGVIKLLSNNKKLYFINAAGIGFDAFVVNKITTLKKLGSIAYLIGGLSSFFNYKSSKLSINLDNKIIKTKTFILSVGLCKYSGGGLQLTDYNNHKKGFFDITIIENIKLLKVIFNINNLFNGNLRKLKEVKFYQNKVLKVKINDTHIPYIQSDGELLGKGNVEIKIIENAINFVIP